MLNAASSLEAIHHWHCDVQKYDIRSVLTHLTDGIGSVRSLTDDLNISPR
jgi:hypothetical protein